jgi:hypothetical protein
LAAPPVEDDALEAAGLLDAGVSLAFELVTPCVGAAVLLASAAEAPPDASTFAEGSVAFAGVSPAFFFEPLSRKSVTYQPEPLRTKPGAVSCLEKLASWQLGHSDNGASESF